MSLTVPFAPPPNHQESEFFEILGRCFAEWAGVESNLCLLFVNLIKPERNNPTLAAFYAATGFETKLRMVDSAAQFALTGEDLTEWRAIFKRIGPQQKCRNQLAHFGVEAMMDPRMVDKDGNFRTNVKDVRSVLQLAPALMNVNAEMKGKRIYRTRELKGVLQAFDNLRVATFLFAIKVSKKNPRPLPKASR